MKNLKFAFRMLKRNPLLTYISIPGLAVGLCAILLLMIYLKYEFSFDRHFPTNKRVLRLCNNLYGENQTNTMNTALRKAYTDLPRQVPEIEKAVQMFPGWEIKVKTANGTFKDLQLMYAEEEFFDVFGLKLLAKSAKQPLSGLKDIVLTKSTAIKLFGTIDCIGNELIVDDTPLLVSGITDDLPITTHFRFDMLQPMKSNSFITQQGSLDFRTYYLMKEGSDLKNAEKNIARINDELMQIWKAKGKLNEGKTSTSTELLRNIHLYTQTNGDMIPKTNHMQLFIVIGIALFIFLIALINFLNMYLLYGEKRIAEISSRKVVGASRWNLAGQFLRENCIIGFFAILIGVWLAVFVQPSFARMINLPLKVSDIFTPMGIVMILMTFIVIILLIGVYPGFYLSKINLVSGLKGKHKNNSHADMSKSVVVMQFFITILLVCSLIVIRAQIKHMKNIPLGFNATDVITIRDFSENAARNTPSIKNELEKLPFIHSVGISQHSMGERCSGQTIALLNSPEVKPVNEYRVLAGFCEIMRLQLKDGSFFTDNKDGKPNIVLNEAAAQMLGLKFSPGVEVLYKGEPTKVTGIVKNFYSSGYAGENIEPLVLSQVKDRGYIFYLRTNGAFSQENQKLIAGIIKKFDPDYQMSFTPLGTIYSAKFEKDERIFRMVSSGAFVSIILSFVGMLALTILNVTRRTKEIGIRKVFGSSETGIMKKLIGETLVLVSISAGSAFAVAYFLMERWLNNFASKIDIHIGYFLLSGLFAFAMAILTVGLQSWRAATRNPVESLRYE